LVSVKIVTRRVWVLAALLVFFHADAAFANNCKEKAYIASMKSDLRNAITAQEEYYADHESHYATSVEAMGTNYKPTSGVTITFLNVDSTSWSAHASDVSTAESCDIVAGDSKAWTKAQRENSSNPVCTKESSSLSLPPIEEIIIALAVALIALATVFSTEVRSSERTIVTGLALGLMASVLIPRQIICGRDDTYVLTVLLGFLLVVWFVVRLGISGVKATRGR
jgi:hypothetical protein